MWRRKQSITKSNDKTSDIPTASDGLAHAKNNLMHEGSGTGKGSRFYLPHNEVAWFYADTGAETDLGFGENTWKAYIRTEKIDKHDIGHNFTVDICKVTSDGTINILASHSKTLTETHSTPLWEITCEDNEDTTQDFSTGDWLAIRLSWDCKEDKLQIHYKAEEGSDSYIQSPPSDPGYPTIETIPEFTTIAIPIAIVLGLMFLFHRRKQKG